MRIILDLLEHQGIFIVQSPEHPELFVSGVTLSDALSRLADCLDALGALPTELKSADVDEEVQQMSQTKFPDLSESRRSRFRR